MRGEGTFSNADHILALREERLYEKKIRDDVNVTKLKELVADLDRTDFCLIPCAKNTGAWTNVRATMLNGTLLAATLFHDFYAQVMMSPPLNFIENTTAAPKYLMYVTDLSSENKALSSHTTTNCMTKSYTLIENSSLLSTYVAIPSYTRSTAYQRGR